MEADARAMQILEQLAKLTSPVDNPKVSMDDVLASFHGARDKHIFRILATVTDPAHGCMFYLTTDGLTKRLSELLID